MDKRVVFMFSGQGSQYYQMGKELYENHALFKHWMDHCSEIISPMIQTSLIDILYNKHEKSESFDRVLHTNPALLSIEYSLAKVLMEMGVQPDYLMGYSLGELTATVVSSAISFEDGAKVVVGVAKLLEERGQTAAMMAIMAEKMIVAHSPDFFSQCWITGTNFSESFVVCGSSDTLSILQRNLKNEGIVTQILPVKYGFHTPLIDSIEEDYKQIIYNIRRSPIETPIISSLKADIIEELSDDYLWDIIRYPVNFSQTVEKTIKKGDCIFIDVGPSGSLATSVKYILSSDSDSGSIPLQFLNQFGKDLDALEKLKTSLFSI